MEYITLTLPGGKQLQAPASIPTGGTDKLAKILGNALSTMIVATVLITLVFLVLGGLQWISSGGDKNKIAAARHKITWAIIGLIVALCSYFIISVVGGFFNVKLFGV